MATAFAPAITPTEFLTPGQAAAALSVSEVTIRRWVSDERIPSFKVGISRRIRRDVVEAMMNPSCTVQPRPGDWRDADEFIRLLRPND